MRLLICAGGTGGGVYPALAVLRALTVNRSDTTEQQAEGVDVLWVGGAGGMEADLVEREGVRFEAIPAAGVHGVGWQALPGNLLRLGRGYLAARQVLTRFRPDVIFSTGGYVTVPVVLAGRRLPLALFVPDIEPGLALKTAARFAERIAVSVDDSRAYFPAQATVTVTGYPTRPELVEWDRSAACQALGLDPEQPVLLVFGGSSGARSINRALIPILPSLLEQMQVVHISGQLDWDEVQSAQRQLASEHQARYHAFAYLHERMGAAFTAADLVVSRAGASALGEFPLFGLPAILVPYPYAWRYQRVNAEYLSTRGAAVLLPDEDLPERLLAKVQALIADHSRREAMSQAMRSLAQPDAANNIAKLLCDLATNRSQERI